MVARSGACTRFQRGGKCRGTTTVSSPRERRRKELVARAVHARSAPPRHRSFGNCAPPRGADRVRAVRPRQGAFTGRRARTGPFQPPDDALLDESVSCRQPQAAPRAIQERSIRPSATTATSTWTSAWWRHQSGPGREVARALRETLLRLTWWRFAFPRCGTAGRRAAAADHLRRFAAETPAVPRLSGDAKPGFPSTWFRARRELENLIERAVASHRRRSDGGRAPAVLAGPAHALSPGGRPGGIRAREYLAQIERRADRPRADGIGSVKKDAAARLGLTFRQFRHR